MLLLKETRPLLLLILIFLVPTPPFGIKPNLFDAEKSKPVRVSELVPTPRNVSLRAVPSGSSDPSESATETTVTGSLDLVVSWEHPFSVRESSNELYEFLQSYEVILDGKFYRIAADTNQFILPNINN